MHPFDAQAQGELSLAVDDYVIVRQVHFPPPFFNNTKTEKDVCNNLDDIVFDETKFRWLGQAGRKENTRAKPDGFLRLMLRNKRKLQQARLWKQTPSSNDLCSVNIYIYMRKV